jgi:hypothetical protein
VDPFDRASPYRINGKVIGEVQTIFIVGSMKVKASELLEAVALGRARKILIL